MKSNTVPSNYDRGLLSAVAGSSHLHSIPHLSLVPVAISIETHAGIESSFTNQPLHSPAVVL